MNAICNALAIWLELVFEREKGRGRERGREGGEGRGGGGRESQGNKKKKQTDNFDAINLSARELKYSFIMEWFCPLSSPVLWTCFHQHFRKKSIPIPKNTIQCNHKGHTNQANNMKYESENSNK